MFIYTVLFIILGGVIWWFTQRPKPAKVQEPEPEVKVKKVKQPQPPPGQSLKQLKKNISKKGHGAGNDPKDSVAYLYCVKANVIDFDILNITSPGGQSQFVAVVAENNQVTALLLTGVQKTHQTVLKLPYKLCSVTLSRPQQSGTKYVVVIACFDQSLLLTYSLVLTDSQQLKFGPEQMSIPKAHDVPVGRARLCRSQARFLVTCGEGPDLFFKLWNLQTQQCEHKFKTGQLNHKLMANNQEHDLFAVAAGTHEVRIYGLATAAHSKGGQILDKIMTLTTHKNVVIDVAFSGLYCVTVSQDMILCLHLLNLEFRSSKLVMQTTVDVDEASKISIYHSPAIASQPEEIWIAVTTASNDIVILDKFLKQRQRIHAPHNGEVVNQIGFISEELLWSVSRLDGRVNAWKLIV